MTTLNAAVPADLTFREAAVADLDAVLILYGQLNPDDSPVSTDKLRSTFEHIFRTAGLSLFVVERNGVVVATTYLNVIPNLTRGGAPYAVIENVVVEQSIRGCGIGKQAMAATLNAAWQAGCYKAMLQTGSKKESTHAFYRACGFSDGEKTAYVARPS